MNNSWNTLSDSVNQFTRASGAAQRVIGLMDNLPHIDPKKGEHVNKKTMKGQLKMEKVEFFYQMRPTQVVLKGVDLNIPGGSVCALGKLLLLF